MGLDLFAASGIFVHTISCSNKDSQLGIGLFQLSKMATSVIGVAGFLFYHLSIQTMLVKELWDRTWEVST